MPRSIIITAQYFREFRRQLGFSNQTDAKNFFGAKDITPMVDFDYIQLLNERLYEMVDRVNRVVDSSIRPRDIEKFKIENITQAFETMRSGNILPLLNNQGRRPEDVYFAWMRGYVLSNYFLKALSIIFGGRRRQLRVTLERRHHQDAFTRVLLDPSRLVRVLDFSVFLIHINFTGPGLTVIYKLVMPYQHFCRMRSLRQYWIISKMKKG